MTFDTALIIAAFIIIASVIGVLSVASSRHRRAKDEEMKRAASMRGWQFESVAEKGFRVHRYRGTTDGVAWVAESMRDLHGSNHPRKRKRIARWRTTSAVGMEKPIVCLGVPK